MFQTIVVAVDGSEPSKRALTAACELARAFGSEVHLIHALENKGLEQADQDSGDATSAVLQSADEQARAAGVSLASKSIGEGDPYDEIMMIVGLYSADLVVTGRRGLGNISGFFAGSTSQQIAKNAECAFMSIK